MDESIRGRVCGCCSLIYGKTTATNILHEYPTYGYLRNCHRQYPGTMLVCAAHLNVHINHVNFMVNQGEWDEDWNAVQISVATGKPVKIWRHKKGEGHCEGKKV
jgi:hypothetical protein